MAEDIKYYWKDKAGRAIIAAEHTKTMAENFSEEIQNSIDNSIIYSPEDIFSIAQEKVESMPVKLATIGSVEAIMEYADGKTAVLNFASYKNPGGGFLAGSRAQEECLCHESFLFNVLKEFSDYYKWNEQNKNNALYKNRAIYSPDVRFEHMSDYKYCDVITCAAPNITPSRKYGYGITSAQNSQTLESRIKFVLDIAAENQVDTLILGAFGCGVFGQDATEVANLFIKYLSTTHKIFKKVIFAVPNDIHGTNYMKFYKALNARR